MLLTALTFIKSYWKLFVGAGIGIVLAYTPIYLYGKYEGRKEQKAIIETQTSQAYKDRQDVDQGIDNSDSYNVCIRLGGLPDKCRK